MVVLTTKLPRFPLPHFLYLPLQLGVEFRDTDTIISVPAKRYVALLQVVITCVFPPQLKDCIFYPTALLVDLFSRGTDEKTL